MSHSPNEYHQYGEREYLSMSDEGDSYSQKTHAIFQRSCDCPRMLLDWEDLLWFHHFNPTFHDESGFIRNAFLSRVDPDLLSVECFLSQFDGLQLRQVYWQIQPNRTDDLNYPASPERFTSELHRLQRFEICNELNELILPFSTRDIVLINAPWPISRLSNEGRLASLNPL